MAELDDTTEQVVEQRVAETPLLNIRHKQFDDLLRWLRAKTVNGMYVPVWCYGAPGAGKSHIAEQLTEELGCAFYPIPLGPTTTESKILGYRNASTGEYVRGLAIDPYEKGGLLYLDEADVADPSVLVATNGLLSNKTFRFPDGILRSRHPEFRCLAGANTLGTGSTQGFKRSGQDAALRSRFIKFKLEYDHALENALSEHKPWVDYVQKVRKYIGTLAKCGVWITSRDMMYGAAALREGVPPDQVVECTIFAELSTDIRQLVVNHCGKFNPAPPSALNVPVSKAPIPEPTVVEALDVLDSALEAAGATKLSDKDVKATLKAKQSVATKLAASTDTSGVPPQAADPQWIPPAYSSFAKKVFAPKPQPKPPNVEDIS